MGDTQERMVCGFVVENPSKMDDDWGYPRDLGSLHMFLMEKILYLGVEDSVFLGNEHGQNG